MTLRPAYDEIVLDHGSHAVILRPSLRAASTLERNIGFDRLFQRIGEFHTGTVREIILTAATDRKDATRFLRSLESKSLLTFQRIAQIPAAQLVVGFMPQSEGNSASHSKAVPWREAYRNLFRAATGILGWSPEEAWNATPTEINEAFIGRVGEPDQQAQHDPAQAARNESAGLDPEFDRAGLQALKAKYGRKSR
ncbi:MAG: phage tail assembly chaperone [Bosea sp.]|uniref:hypothetical protein n=1 Tax=Bosea sp. (in: a-proteobacteria) TaxID=1871050 RepID=UPI001AC20463|nr:hypothetical protein [Bosea sp. (in: a-proteobacteria)]MBN9450472.1 phage tail assembly chaperone [Bosea sp. (in: a-proteobacteria)]